MSNARTSPLSNRVLNPGVKWLPFQGDQTTGVAGRSKLDDDAQAQLILSAAEILGSGVDPTKAAATATGLVVGYVQSGKTLNFTTVIALARDNGFPLVIVIAGNKTNLLGQSHDRLVRDLDVDGGDGLPAWIMEKNPKAQSGQYEQLLRQTIDNWGDPTRDQDEKPTLLLTVLKQNQRLASLTALLRKFNLLRVPALIIDDEADQASLNTKVNQGDESPTYTRVRELRAALPWHTYLQYTATPQAPLLINIADTLSPDFVHVLQPGSGYVGGTTFFAPNSPYIEVIPPGDIPPGLVMPNDPPDSLLIALRVFFVGLAVSIMAKSGRRSMLIHPAREKVVHQACAQWASAAKDLWLGILGDAPTDPDRIELEGDFKKAYDELARTEPSLPDFAAVMEKMPRALRNTVVIEFNTRGSPKTPEINWRHAEGWILVGGQAVDRGFTVDSLSVTYMPRGIGVGNADTIQQRARFFGYKQRYLGLCRIWIEQGLRQAFEDYVEHEQTMRTELKQLAQTGQDLRTWRRRLILDPTLQPCRRSVVSDPFTRTRAGGGWTEQRGALLPPADRQHNAGVFQKLLNGLNLVQDQSYVSNEQAQQHLVASNVPLQRVVDALVDYRAEDPRDTAAFTGLLVTASEALRRDPTLTATVYQMRPRATDTKRGIAADGTIENFMQGRTDRPGGYPGDHFFSRPNQLTVQLHTYDLTRNKNVVAQRAPLLVLHVPPALARNWLFQVQANQPQTP